MLFRVPVPAPFVGVVDFKYDGADLPGVTSIEYFQNNKPLSGKLYPPYDFSIDSRLEWDGPNRIRAVAYDADWNIVDQQELLVWIGNTGGTIASTVDGVDVADQVLSGTVDWTVSVTSITDVHYGLQAIFFYVDGGQRLITSWWPFPRGPETAVYSLDTTQLINGTHELSATAVYSWITGTPDYGRPASIRLQATTSVEVDNGHITCQLRPRWRELRLAPGESVNLELGLTYTDGVGRDAVATATISSDRPDVATCDSSGLVTAIAVGATQLTVTVDSQTIYVFVKVKDFTGLPHFGWNGELLTSYVPHHSVFVRSLFTLGPGETSVNPIIIPKLWAASINTLETGFYTNPADDPSLTTYTLWENRFDSDWAQIKESATVTGLSILLTGDAICRHYDELHNSITGPFATQAIQYALTKAVELRGVVGIEMIDEVNLGWGDTPTPTDGRWLVGPPSIPDNAFITLMSIINGVTDRPKNTWPVISGSSLEAIANWTGNPSFSSYATHYWSMYEGAGLYAAAISLPQLCYSGFYNTIEGSSRSIPPSFPRLMEVTATGPYYTKYVDSSEFVYGDHLEGAGSVAVLPMQVSAQIMYAAAAGMAGVRVYSYDSSGWKNRRAGAVGSTSVQTGIDPDSVGLDRWEAMSVTFAFVKDLEPYVLQDPISPVDLGPMVYTAARQMPTARVFMAINMSEVPALLQPDLTPYTYTTTETHVVERRRILGDPIRSIVDTVPDTGTDSLTLQSGESVVWIFTVPPPPPPPPTPPTIVERGDLFGWDGVRKTGDFIGWHV